MAQMLDWFNQAGCEPRISGIPERSLVVGATFEHPLRAERAARYPANDPTVITP
jgi:hypothetical protein